MPFMILDSLKERVSEFSLGAFGALLPVFGGVDEVPDRLAVRPVDVWDGDPRIGALLFDGVFTKSGEHLALEGAGWDPKGVDESWVSHIHGFTWLRDLRAFANAGGHASRGQASAVAWMMILAWIDNYNHSKALKSDFYRLDVAGERISMWVSMFDFFCPECFEGAGDEEFHDQFFEALIRHGQYLSKHVSVQRSAKLYGVAALKAAKGLLYCGLALEGCEDWSEKALERLRNETEAQILSDGAHVSRSPQQLLEVLQILLDIRGAMNSAGQRVPDFVQHGIDRIGPALRFYRYNDRQLALYHGGQKLDSGFIDSVLAQTGVRGKALESLPCAGFERVARGRTLLTFDCGDVSTAPYDKGAHAAPLSFEMSYAKQRVFVNCGTHPNDQDWRGALRGGAAHNTLSIDGFDGCEIAPHGGFGRKPMRVTSMREDSKAACLLEASHDGFRGLNGFDHSRRIYVSDSGHDIRGEDYLESAVGIGRVLPVAIRFHLHPNVTVSLINNGQEALLRLAGGVGWRFKHSGGELYLGDSVFLGDGAKARKSKQLVIIGQVSDYYSQFKWAMRKEG